MRRLPTHLPRQALFLISVVIVVLDQASKAWICSHLQPGVAAPFLPGLLQLRWVRNTGAAFSLFRDSTVVLGVLSLLVAVVVAVWLWRSRQQALWQGLGLGCLLGGTVGNGLDRWRLGHVTDFLELVPIDFPIFNGADIAINLAVACFVIDALSQRHGRPQN
ncbi:MAG: signal peptidase II [Synechococcus sp.]